MDQIFRQNKVKSNTKTHIRFFCEIKIADDDDDDYITEMVVGVKRYKI
jgi:hypothetical protein